MTLETSHIGKGCDRDTYNLASQRQLCGASELALDLLPDSEQVKIKHTASNFFREINFPGNFFVISRGKNAELVRNFSVSKRENFVPITKA